MPNWNLKDRGQNRDEQSTYFGDNTDWDGKSCADYWQLPGRGVEDNPLTGDNERDESE